MIFSYMDYKVSCNYYLQIFAVHAIFYFFKGKDMGLVFIKGHVCFEILVTEKAKKNLHSIAHIFSYLSSAFSASRYENKSTKLE